MNQQERRGWFILTTLFLVLLLVLGCAYGTIEAFVPALPRGFPSCSRAKF
jgi:hypothetical protein